ncbi:MAG: hypothetical protein IT374_04220 [Polyangiaceae bacterium]|nr:hypothetical protein [Polyangiaceae bacterium]
MPPAARAEPAPAATAAPPASATPRERDKPLSTPHAEVPGWLEAHGTALLPAAPLAGARAPADEKWLAHASVALARSLASLPTYRPKRDPALATTVALRVGADGTVSDVRVVAPSGTLLDLVVVDALGAPFPALSREPVELVAVVECRGSAWPESRGVTVAVAGDRPCRVASLSAVGVVAPPPTKVRPI